MFRAAVLPGTIVSVFLLALGVAERNFELIAFSILAIVIGVALWRARSREEE